MMTTGHPRRTMSLSMVNATSARPFLHRKEINVVVSFSSSHDDGDGAALYSGTMNIVTTPSAFGSGTLRGSVLRGLGAAAAATTTTAAAALL